jgi:hypothetical protein
LVAMHYSQADPININMPTDLYFKAGP